MRMMSATEFAPNPGCVTSTLGVVESRITGAKSFWLSYGIFEYRLWLIACVPTVPTISV